MSIVYVNYFYCLSYCRDLVQLNETIFFYEYIMYEHVCIATNQTHAITNLNSCLCNFFY